jgi:hypothetical protein
MNEWGFICQDIFAGIGMSATINIFKQQRGFEENGKVSAF